MGFRAVTDPGMSFQPACPPAWQEHHGPAPLLQGQSWQWGVAPSGSVQELWAWTPGVLPQRWPGPAEGGTEQVVAASSHIPTMLRGPACVPISQAQMQTQCHPIHPRVTGSEPLPEGPGCPGTRGAQLTGYPTQGKQVQHEAWQPHPGKAGAARGLAAAGECEWDTWVELPVPTALSKSRVMHLEAAGSNSVLVSPAPVGTGEVPTQGEGDTCHTLGKIRKSCFRIESISP